MNTRLPEKVKIQTYCTGRRLSSLFQIKDYNKKEHEHDIVYHVHCAEDNCIGESGKRLVEPAKDHSGRYNKSHVKKYFIEKRTTEFEKNDFKINGRHCKND